MSKVRPGVELAMGLVWSLPLLLLYWYDWQQVLWAVSANCLLWSLPCLVLWRRPHWGDWLFRPEALRDGFQPRFRSAAVGLWLGGIAILAASFIEM